MILKWILINHYWDNQWNLKGVLGLDGSNISMLIMQKYQFTVSESFISTYSVKSLLKSVGEPGLCPADDRFVELYYVVAIWICDAWQELRILFHSK